MIPRLYEANERSFDHLGLGGLPETKSCIVTEERNGQFELEMVYPMDGSKFELIQPERIIYAPHDDTKTRQPFRIYKTSRAMNGDITIYARHISYDLSKMTVKPFSASSVAQAMAGLKSNTIGEQPFTFWTDKTTVANFKVEEPSTVRSRLGGVQGSILDVFGGGEYEWDHFTVRLRQNRGADNGVSLRFGKNLTDLVSEEDSTNVYTSCVPFWKKENTVIMLEDFVVHSEYEDLFDNAMCIPLDLSSELTSEDQDYVPTTTELREAAEAHMNRNLAWIITQSISAQFVALWQTEEFRKTALVQRLKLCDTVWALHPKLGVNASAKVIRTVYDVLLERYSSIEIGEARTDLNGTLVTQRDIEKTVEEQKSAVQLELEHALDLMSGASGGNVVIRRNAAGNPYEILIMDTDDITTAVNVLRLNMNGIAFSQSGYNGPFTTAWTIDSHFVADFITAGTFNGNLIKAGIIQDAAGVNYWNMTTGEFQLTPAAKIKTGTNSYVALSSYIGGIADNAVAELEEDLQAQIDGKIDTFYQSADPSTGWTAAEKTAHTGDLWYKTTDNTTWRWSGSAWQEQEVPDAVFDEIDGKSAIFYGTTSQTYTGVQTGDYLVDSTTGSTYRWSGSAWVKQTDYATAIATALDALEEDLQEQIDGKIDTFYQSSDPSTNWTTEQKTAHTGDLWYKTTDSSTWRWSGSAWQEQSVPDEVFDAIDGKSTIFYGTTSGTYTGVQTGDYLVDSTSGKTYRWNGSSWVVQTDYASAISNYDTSLNQQAVFNKLTNNSQNEGVYLSNGHLYVNGSMIRAGEIDAGLIKAGILQSQDSNSNFSLNMLTGAISMKDATLTGGSLTTENGLYKTIIENGFLRHYHNGDYFGKVGSSIFTQNKKGMMFDIGYDADYGGFAVQESANADASLAFWYDRVGDQFISAKDIYMQSNDLTVASIIGNQQLNLEASQFNFNKKSGTTGNVIAEGDIYMNTSDKVATESYVNTQLSGYATQSWVNSQGFLKTADFSQYATQDWAYDTFATYDDLFGYLPKYKAIGQYRSDSTYTGFAPTKMNYGGAINSSGGLDMTNAPISTNHAYWGNQGMETSHIEFIVPQSISSNGTITKWAEVRVYLVNGFVETMSIDPDNTGAITRYVDTRHEMYPIPS